MTERIWLRSVAIRDFRNLERVDLSFPAEGIAVVGDNGQGKTNLLESIYYMQLLRSVRGARDVDLVRFGAAGFHIAADAELDEPCRIGVGFDKAGKRKRVTHGGAVVSRLSDALGGLPSVIFSPRDVDLVAGAPSERRRFLDVVLALTSRPYLQSLQAYRSTLLRRNAVLRELTRRRARGEDQEQAAIWEPALAEHGARLYHERRDWILRYAERFTELCSAIGERGVARVAYSTSLEGSDDPRSSLTAALERQRSHDVRRGMTHAGPHRDDLDISIGGRDIRLYGSAGQQRTAAIALRMLEAATLREHVRREPLLLLDDPFAELDARRSARILGILAGAGLGQTILAVPRVTDIPAELTSLPRMRIEDGVLSELVA